MKKLYLLAFALIGAISNVFTAQADNVALTLSSITDGASAWLTAPGNKPPYNQIVKGASVEAKAEAVAALFADNTLIGERRLVWGTGQNKKAGDKENEIDLVNVATTGFDYKGRNGIGGEYVAQIYDMTEDATGISVSFDAAGTLSSTSFSVWSITGGRARLIASTSSAFTASNLIKSEDTKILSGDRVVFLWTGSTAGNTVNITNFSAYYTQGSIARENISYEVTDPIGTVQSGVYQGVTGISVPAFTGAYGMTLTEGRWDGNTYKATVNFPFPVGKPTTIMSAIGTTSYLYGKDNVVKADAKGGNEEILPTDQNGADYLWNIIPVFDGTNVSFKLQNIGKNSYISSSDAALVDAASAGKFTYSETGVSSGVGFMVVGSTDKFLSVQSSTNNDQTVAIWTKTTGSTDVGANLSFRDIQAEFDALPKSESNKFNLVAGATVISPSEYASPSDINTAIDAAAACDTDAKKVAFLLGTNGTNLTQFKNASAAHGNPVSFTYTIKGGKWGTLFSQVNFKRPTEWTLYQCAKHTDGVLTLTEYSAGETKNKPYLVKTTATEDKTYQIIGYAKGAATANTKIGLLTGVIVKNTKIPENSYILASKDGVQAFHKVTTNAMNAQVNKAYLTMPAEVSSARSIIFIEDEATSINEIFGAEESVANNGKFVENGRVVIVKGGVKYNIAGQIVK